MGEFLLIAAYWILGSIRSTTRYGNSGRKSGTIFPLVFRTGKYLIRSLKRIYPITFTSSGIG